MKKILKKVIAVVIISVLCTGCGLKEKVEEKVKEKIQEQIAEKLDSIESVSANIKFITEINTKLGTINGDADMDVDAVRETGDFHMKGKINQEQLLGISTVTPVEVYKITKNDKDMLYIKTDDSNKDWTEIELKDQDSHSFNNTIDDLSIKIQQLSVDKETKEINGQKCYVLDGMIVIDAEMIQNIITTPIIGEYGLGDVIDEEKIKDAEVPCTISVYKKSLYPALVELDLKEGLAATFSELYAVEDSLQKCSLSVQFNEYNGIEEITFSELL